MGKHLSQYGQTPFSFQGPLFLVLHSENRKKILIGMFSAIHGLHVCMCGGCLLVISKLDPGLTSLVPALGEFARETEFFGHEPCDAAHESEDCPFWLSQMPPQTLSAWKM